jgi:hypothetical protein
MTIISTDTSYVLGQDGITQFKVITITYDDGSQDIIKRPDGNATDIVNTKATEIEVIVNDLVENSQIISKVNQRLKELKEIDAAMTTQIGKSPLQVIQDRYKLNLLNSGWTINEGSGFVPIVFTINTSNVLKYSINGAANKNAKCYGGIIELINYPASNIDTDFFLSENEGLYFSLPNRIVKIKKP